MKFVTYQALGDDAPKGHKFVTRLFDVVPSPKGKITTSLPVVHSADSQEKVEEATKAFIEAEHLAALKRAEPRPKIVRAPKPEPAPLPPARSRVRAVQPVAIPEETHED